MTKLLPDVSFKGSTATNPQVTITIKPQDYPGAPLGTSGDGTVTRTTGESVDIQEFDQIRYIRLRARSLAFRLDCANTGVMWKLGTNRIEVRQDGRK